MIPSTAWLEDAACRGADTELFYPQRGESSGPARMVCFECPVRQQCEDHAIATHERYGVWGGWSERDRRAIRRARKVEAVA